MFRADNGGHKWQEDEERAEIFFHAKLHALKARC